MCWTVFRLADYTVQIIRTNKQDGNNDSAQGERTVCPLPWTANTSGRITKMLPECDPLEIEQALTVFDRKLRNSPEWRGWTTRRHHKYAIDHEGKLYPPKQIVAIATGVSVGTFSGGYQTNHYLEQRGFTVISLIASEGEGSLDLPFFKVGQTYQRRTEITGRFGGSGQSGIAPSARVPAVFLFTGESGEQFGYTDRIDQSGVIHYTGEGQKGKMEMTRGNAAIANHARDGRALHAFRATGKGKPCIYLGEFCYGSHFEEEGPDKDGKQRTVIVFRLVPVASTLGLELSDTAENLDIEAGGAVTTGSLDELRKKAIRSSSEQLPSEDPKAALRTVYRRSADVKAYVLMRAEGVCELCFEPAPFVRRNIGTPYLEPHHINRLSDGGLDHPKYVAAICPNCHRHIHFGVDGSELNDKLRSYVASIEDEMEV